MKKRILVVGMLDSIHLSRWISQFQYSDLDIRILPSAYFRRVHPKIVEQTSEYLAVPFLQFTGRFFPFIDYFFTLSFMGTRIEQRIRRFYIAFYAKLFRPEIIHALEIQHAGYIVAGIKQTCEKRILTNWGSDIYYYQYLPGHRHKIEAALEWASHYSAECLRDYKLARDFGFKGSELPKIPNAGGFNLSNKEFGVSRNENQIIVKTYGGEFGLGELALQIVSAFLSQNLNAVFFLYSVTRDLESSVEELCAHFPSRVSFSLQRKPLSHENLAEKFQESSIYLGLSKTDGLSTSFLESLVHGVYPIQTNTSCASEVIEQGAIGSVVMPDFEEIFNELERVFKNQRILHEARVVNRNVAQRILEVSAIAKVAQQFYS
jgi:glycosyltransferase involved in cell wall biosynthesis